MNNIIRPEIESSFYGYSYSDHPACYQATITKDKIIATISDRSEFEILQHRGVKDVQEITPTKEEIIHALEEHSKHLNG